MRAQSAKSGRYYRESSRFVGANCCHNGKSVRADIVEAKISEVIESLVLPENWRESLHEILNTKKDEIDPQKEKARIKGELRRMRDSFNHGLYENEEHLFWREKESLEMQLKALEQLTPYEVRRAGSILENLQQAWAVATMEEKQQLCQIILKQVVYDFGSGEIVRIQPNAEYDVLFKMMGAVVDRVVILS